MSNEYDMNNQQSNLGGQQDSSGSYHYTAENIPGGNSYSSYDNQNTQSADAGTQAPPTGGYQQNPYQQNPYQQNSYQQNPYGQNSYQQNQYRQSNPMSGYNVTPPQQKPPKKSGGRGAIIAIVIVCAILAGGIAGAAVGGIITSVTKNNGSEDVVMEEGIEADTEADVEVEVSEEPSEDTDAADAHDNISTTVIDVKTNSTETSMTPQNVYDQYVNAVVAISNESITTNFLGQTSATASSGSGFIISEDGYIVTNNHVVEDAVTLTVIMTSGEEYDATIIGADEESDVALIKIDAEGLPTVSVGDSDSIQVGEQVCAIGNPLGELTNTLTVGYISALDREIYESSTGSPINMFQTDCAINAGNSGGPLFDMNGNVVGITTAKYSSSSSSSASIEGIGFCIPINDAMDVISDLLEYGYVRGRAYLGISCQDIPSTVTQYYNMPTGVYVYSVEEGSAAEAAGLEAGDIITAVDGTETSSVTEFKTLLKEYSAGDTAVLTVFRSSDGTKDMTVTFDEKVSTVSTDETEESNDAGTGEEQAPMTTPGSSYSYGWSGTFE